MSTPLLGVNAVILDGGVEVGYCKGVNLGIDTEMIKEYKIGSQTPEVLSMGNKSFKVSIDRMYIDKTYGNKVLAGTDVTLEIRPAGSGAGKEKITLTNVLLNSWELRIAQDAIILESVSGESKSLAFGTQ